MPLGPTPRIQRRIRCWQPRAWSLASDRWVLSCLIQRGACFLALMAAGEDVTIAGSVSDEEATQKFPQGWKAPKPYLRIVPQPK